MRTDANLDLPPILRLGPIETAGHPAAYSLSGFERNCLFSNRGDAHFDDVSGISGIDHPADGRAFAVLDYDRDGWNDLAVVNANAPLFQLFRNELASQLGSRNAIGIRLIGESRSPEPCAPCSNRDAVGARLAIEVAGDTLIRELQIGEGLAGQNSSTLTVGLGAATQARVRVRFPSGTERDYGELGAGAIYSLEEGTSEARRLSAFTSASRTPARRGAALASIGAPLPPAPQGVRIRLFTTMATWCAACAGELPRLSRLADRFGDELAIYGVPTDADDTPSELADYVEKRRPPYRLLDRTDAAQTIERIGELVRERLHGDVLPASVLLDRNGAVLAVVAGAPSASEIARHLSPP